MPEQGPRGAPPLRPLRWRLALILILVLGVALLLLGPVLARVAVDGRAELAHADAARERGDPDGEIRHLGRAARFRLPLASHDELALARLHQVARSAEQDQQHHAALAAWRELRSALIGTRVIDVRDPALLAQANAAIVQLMVREAEARGRQPEPQRWAQELEEGLEPRARSLFAALCFVAWLGACVGFFARGLDGKGRLDPRPALRWGGSLLLLLIGWIASM